MKAIVTVIGKDKVGIISKVTGFLSERGVNVEDISQTILRDYFAMFMLVETFDKQIVAQLSGELEELGKQIGVNIRIQHEDIFNAMHRI